VEAINSPPGRRAVKAAAAAADAGAEGLQQGHPPAGTRQPARSHQRGGEAEPEGLHKF